MLSRNVSDQTPPSLALPRSTAEKSGTVAGASTGVPDDVLVGADAAGDVENSGSVAGASTGVPSVPDVPAPEPLRENVPSCAPPEFPAPATGVTEAAGFGVFEMLTAAGPSGSNEPGSFASGVNRFRGIMNSPHSP